MSDFENMPKYFPAVAKSLRIISKQGNDFEIEAETKSFGMNFKVKMKTQLRPPLGFISENTSMLGVEHESFLMEEVTEGTKINYINDVEIKNYFFRIFARPLIGLYAMRFWKHAVIDKLKEMLEK